MEDPQEHDRHGAPGGVTLRSSARTLKRRARTTLLDTLAAAYLRVFRAGDEHQRYDAADDFTRRVHPSYVFSEFGRSWLQDEEFFRYYRRFDDSNFHSADRKYLLRELLKLVHHVPGAFAECGVYRGGSAFLLCQAAERQGREVHLFDSFSGLSAPGERDGDYWTEGALSVDEKNVRERLGAYERLIAVHAGWIPDRFADVEDSQFAFVHIDVDLYQPTADSLRFFYPRLAGGGIIVCDDYGFTTCPGARAAVDEFFADGPEPVLHLPTGQGVVIKSSS